MTTNPPTTSTTITAPMTIATVESLLGAGAGVGGTTAVAVGAAATIASVATALGAIATPVAACVAPLSSSGSGVSLAASSAVTISSKRHQSLDRKSTRLNSSHGYISY